MKAWGVLCATLSFALAAVAMAQPRPAAPAGVCGEPLAVQVLLDRRGFSPGEIDGKLGANAARALSVFQEASGLPVTGTADCTTFKALDDGQPITVDYEVTPADAEGPFVESIPADLPAQADLPQLSYSSIAESLAEQFHAAPRLLAELNPGVRLEPGATIKVPAVTRFLPDTLRKADAKTDAPTTPANQPPRVVIQVSASDSTLRILDENGRVMGSAPVTSGSEHDPLPVGEWKVTGVSRWPTFRYNPDLFWDADPSHTKAIIKGGPNNPVGVVWIDINVEHYGLHGTPEPARVGHTQSHGCVRLTNWDAARVASMVATGSRVVFK
jgi:lipoprotein-anchoring transpeptidase ErfK/SrfK